MDNEISPTKIKPETNENLDSEAESNSKKPRTWDLGGKRLFITESEEERAMNYVHDKKVLRGVRRKNSRKSRDYLSPRKQLAPKTSKFYKRARKNQDSVRTVDEDNMQIQKEPIKLSSCNCSCHNQLSYNTEENQNIEKIDLSTQTE